MLLHWLALSSSSWGWNETTRSQPERRVCVWRFELQTRRTHGTWRPLRQLFLHLPSRSDLRPQTMPRTPSRSRLNQMPASTQRRTVLSGIHMSSWAINALVAKEPIINQSSSKPLSLCDLFLFPHSIWIITNPPKTSIVPFLRVNWKERKKILTCKYYQSAFWMKPVVQRIEKLF